MKIDCFNCSIVVRLLKQKYFALFALFCFLLPIYAKADCRTLTNNLIKNCDFSDQNLSWLYQQQQGGNGSMLFEDDEIVINVISSGNIDWAIQATHPTPIVNGNYILTFEARASADRTIVVNLGEVGDDWTSHFREEISLTNTMQTFEFELSSLPADATARLDFNIGNMGTSSVYLDNVSLIQQTPSIVPSDKACAKDPYNLVSNCSFDDPLSSVWTVFSFDGGVAAGDVSNRELTINITEPGSIFYHVQAHTPVALTRAGSYALTFTARSEQPRNIVVALGHNGDIDGNYEVYAQVRDFAITDQAKTYTITFDNIPADPLARLDFNVGNEGVNAVTIDDIVFKSMILSKPSDTECANVANNLVSNCSFDVPTSTAWTVFAFGGGVGSGDSSNNSLRVNISDPGSFYYHVQAHTPVRLTTAGSYTLSFIAYADQPRDISVALNHNGDIDGNYQNYAEELGIAITDQPVTYTITFDGIPPDPFARLDFNIGDQGINAVTIDEIILTADSFDVPDADADGVDDTADTCPNTPLGETVDTLGCSSTQIDTDNDGVSDYADQCSDTLDQVIADQTGCSLEEKREAFLCTYNAITNSDSSQTLTLMITNMTGLPQHNWYVDIIYPDPIVIDQNSNSSLLRNSPFRFSAVDETPLLSDESYEFSFRAQFTEGQPIEPIISVCGQPIKEPIQVNFNNATLLGNGQYGFLVESGDPFSLTGTIVNTDTPYTLEILSDGVKKMFTPLEDGSFSVVLPVKLQQEYEFHLYESGGLYRTPSFVFVFVVDKQGPQLSLESSLPTQVAGDVVDLIGFALDSQSGLSSVNIMSDRFPDITLNALLLPAGRFSAQLPVEYGVNNLSIVAKDFAGNKTELRGQVTRLIQEVPIIFIDHPKDGELSTANTVDVSGTVYTSLAPELLRFNLGDEVIYPDAPIEPGKYPFRFNNVRLTSSINTLEVVAETSTGAVSANVRVLLGNSAEPSLPALPKIRIAAPLLSTIIRGDSLLVSGTAEVPGGLKSISINRESASYTGTSDNISFEGIINTVGLAEGILEVSVIVIDLFDQIKETKVSVLKDDTLPIINVDNSFLAFPNVNQIVDNPLTLSGTVTDQHLSGLSINGNVVGLLPGSTPNTYDFSVLIDIPVGGSSDLVIKAWDRAGNNQENNYSLSVNDPLDVEIINPAKGANVSVTADQAEIDVTVRLTGDPSGFQVKLAIDDASPVLFTAVDNVISATISLALIEGPHKLVVTTYDSTGANLLSSRSRLFNVINETVIPLELERLEPSHEQVNVDVNQPITFYFNHIVNQDNISIKVYESVNGVTYLKPKRDGDSSAVKAAPSMVAVNKIREVVAGTYSFLADGKTATFYPDKEYTYGAEVFVDVIYGGEELSRTNFRVRALPTFVEGVIFDRLYQPVPGVSVNIPVLGRSSITDRSGAFAFGYGDSATENIPNGIYELTVNADGRNPDIGISRRQVRVEGGRVNDVGLMFVTLNDANNPYRTLTEGSNQTTLAEGALELTLTNTELNYQLGPDKGRGEGQIKAVLVNSSSVNSQLHPAAMTPWVFEIQPPGIEVFEGSIDVRIKAPELFGSLDYLPKDQTPVIIVGLDASQDLIIPVGIGRVDGPYISNTSPLNLSRLDFLGFVLVPQEWIKVLEDYEAGKISKLEWLAQITVLSSTTGEATP